MVRAMRHLLAIVLLFAAGLAAQTPGDPAAARGTCLLAGGGKLPPAIFARFLELAGGAHAKVVLIPTASETADDANENADTLRLYRERLPGAEVTLLHTRERATADDETFCAPLLAATGVWFTGGAQERLAAAYLGTRVERELMAVLARDGVVGGTSAGTAIQTRTMIQEGMDPPVMAQGFDLVPGGISDQHFLKRERLPRLLRALALQPGLFGIGVDEGTAAVVHGDRLDVIGASKVVLVLAGSNGHGEIVDAHAAGDRVDLATWRRAARERAGWQLDVAAPAAKTGSLVLGDSAPAMARFLALAGGAEGKFLVLRLDPGTDAPDPDDPLLKGGASSITATCLTGTSRFGGTDLAEAFDGVTGVWLRDSDLATSRRMLDHLDMHFLRARLAQLLADGGVVCGGALLGDVVFDPSIEATSGVWYERGLGLLPGCALLLDRDATSASAEHTRWQRGIERMPGLTGLRLPLTAKAMPAAIVHGETIEVLGAALELFRSPPAAKAGAAREPLHLAPGARYDLVTGAVR